METALEKIMGKSKSSIKSRYRCQSCGYSSAKWLGRCPDCQEWNSMVEEVLAPAPKQARGFHQVLTSEPPMKLSKIEASQTERFHTGLDELDRVLGGGIVPGSLVLVGGDPGIGKSTILLQMAFQLATAGKKVLYVSGEESAGQIKLRADRIGIPPENLLLFCETQVDKIEKEIVEMKPDVAVVDSIQTLIHPEVGSVPGSVSQVRESGGVMMTTAKNNGPAIFLVGHVTKEGQLAGPRLLEHMVDTVLYFEGDKQHGYRILRAVKNRFGSTNEVGIFEMQQSGLQQIGDPSRMFLSERQIGSTGSAVAVSLEGTRPLLVEIQALVSTAYFGMPQRRVTGVDYNRTCLMLAVLEKRAGMALGAQDVFMSIAGGLTVNEPAVDLAVAAAIASSLKEQPLNGDTALFGEVGLGGEIRAVAQPERRVAEAQQMGFKRCILPEKQLEKMDKNQGMELVGVATITEALAAVFQK